MFTDQSIQEHIHVVEGSGYDGQFSYRLAARPFDLSDEADGITFDSAMRMQRIGYPLLVTVTSGARDALLPWTLILTNVAAFGPIGFIGGVLA